jgi:hypothetical protein
LLGGFLLVWLGLFAAACSEPERAYQGAPAVRLDAMNLGAVSSSPVTGTVAGQDFTVVEARYRIDTFPGRERVDLLLSSAPIRRCGVPVVRDGNMVWLRFEGVTELPQQEQRVSADSAEPAFGLHYEILGETERRYEGRQGGDALVTFGTPELGHIAGKIFACFGDGLDSCVKGSFVATPCFSRIDGRTVREGVGLEDEALEPAREGDPEDVVIPTAGGGDTEGSREPLPPSEASEEAQERVE